MKTYEILNLSEVCKTFWFDAAEIAEIKEMEAQAGAPVLLTVQGTTVAITPPDVDLYFYILRNEANSTLVELVMQDIQSIEEMGYIEEI